MTTSNFSGFLGSIPNLNNNDIMSSYGSTQITFDYGSGESVSLNVGYFYLGDLLIQFLEPLSSTSYPNLGTGTTYVMPFAIEYDTNYPPYFAQVSPLSTNSGVTCSLTDLTNKNLSFHIGNNNGFVFWVVVGPAPSASSS